eukprot:GHVT01018880.1.p1 GENE.GHVT01018880.1~~GHVT01018880.1.p1  ORF type:complete len:326 (+),score=45.53 GHVT01018880.1:1857-2834(+)
MPSRCTLNDAHCSKSPACHLQFCRVVNVLQNWVLVLVLVVSSLDRLHRIHEGRRQLLLQSSAARAAQRRLDLLSRNEKAQQTKSKLFKQTKEQTKDIEMGMLAKLRAAEEKRIREIEARRQRVIEQNQQTFQNSRTHADERKIKEQQKADKLAEGSTSINERLRERQEQMNASDAQRAQARRVAHQETISRRNKHFATNQRKQKEMVAVKLQKIEKLAAHESARNASATAAHMELAAARIRLQEGHKTRLQSSHPSPVASRSHASPPGSSTTRSPVTDAYSVNRVEHRLKVLQIVTAKETARLAADGAPASRKNIRIFSKKSSHS